MIQTNEVHLTRVSNKARFAYYFFIFLFAAVTITWVALIVISIICVVIDGNLSIGLSPSILNLVAVLSSGAVLDLMFYTILMIVRDVVKKRSPFNPAQTKRIKLLALFILLHGLVDFFLVSNYSSWALSEGFVFGNTTDTMASRTINLWAFISAIIVYSLSWVFDYGFELQKQSDAIL